MQVNDQHLAAQLSEIYTLQCRAALNKDYYGSLLARYQTTNAWMEILIAAGATGATGSGLSVLTEVWTTPHGKVVWGVLTIVSTFLAIAKPILQLNKKVEVFSKLFTGYSDLYVTLLVLVSRIKRRRELSDEMIKMFEAAELRFLELSKEDDPKPKMRLLRRCEADIRKRHPPEEAWYPESLETRDQQGEANVTALSAKAGDVRQLEG
jgi:hypothetical protein